RPRLRRATLLRPRADEEGAAETDRRRGVPVLEMRPRVRAVRAGLLPGPMRARLRSPAGRPARDPARHTSGHTATAAAGGPRDARIPSLSAARTPHLSRSFLTLMRPDTHGIARVGPGRLAHLGRATGR